MGDGIAIEPTDGKICAPADDEVSTAADTLHAYGFTTDSGLELLVHVGLDSVGLKAEGALSLIKKDNGIQAVYGPKADVLKSDINDIL